MNDLPEPEALFIGIDQSYTGFGLVVLDETGYCRQKSLLKYPLNKFKDEGARLVKIYDDLLKFFSLYRHYTVPTHIGMEGYAYGAKLNREKLGELGGIVKFTSYLSFGITPSDVAPSALKKYVTGNGKASKEEMVRAVQLWDPEVTDNNIADAYGIAHMLYSS
jgi:Holliday junction resolvasome RuvABC endonuclease subunit